MTNLLQTRSAFSMAQTIVLDKIAKFEYTFKDEKCKALDENGEACTENKNKGSFCSNHLRELLL